MTGPVVTTATACTVVAVNVCVTVDVVDAFVAVTVPVVLVCVIGTRVR